MVKINNLILGSGLAGIIAKIYNPDFVIIDLPVKQETQYQLGPRFLYDCEEVSDLLSKISGFSNSYFKNATKKKTINVGYFFNGKFYDRLILDFLKKYNNKLGKDPNEIYSSMSDNKEKFDVYGMPWFNFWNSINETAKVLGRAHIGRVQNINLEDKEIRIDGLIIKYDKIINTIPAPDFLKLCGIFDSDHFASDIYFSKARRALSYDDRFDFIYYIEKNIDFYRITKVDILHQDKYYVIESLLPISKTRFPENSNLEQIAVLKEKKIISGTKLDLIDDRFNDIFILGRYARWDHSIRMPEMIRDAKRVSEILNE